MSHGRHHHHPGHDHPHERDHHDPRTGTGADPALDLAVPNSELNPGQLRRRGFLQAAGLLGAGIAGGSVLSGSLALADEAVRGAQRARAPARRVLPGWPETTTSTPSTAATRSTAWPTRCSTLRRTAWTGW